MRRRLAAHPMRDLGRRPDRHRVAAPVVKSDDAAAFERHRGVAMMVEAPLQPVRCGGERCGGVALGDRKAADQIGGEPLVHDRRAGAQPGLGIGDGGQYFEIELDPFGGVLGLLTALGDDDGERLADMAHLVVRQQRLLRVQKTVLDEARPFSRHRDLRVGDRWDLLQQFGPA